MTEPSYGKQIPETVAAILDGYRSYRSYFQEITARAQERFVSGNWIGAQSDAVERLDAYQTILQRNVATITEILGMHAGDHRLWAAVKSAIAPQLDQEADPDLAETFFNSVVRRIGNIVGTDPHLEFLNQAPRPLPDPEAGRVYRTFPAGRDSLGVLCRAILASSQFHKQFQDLDRDARQVALHLSACRAYANAHHTIDHVDIVVSPFFRGMGGLSDRKGYHDRWRPSPPGDRNAQ